MHITPSMAQQQAWAAAGEPHSIDDERRAELHRLEAEKVAIDRRIDFLRTELNMDFC